MFVYLTCKNCGKRRRFAWSVYQIPEPVKALQDGWPSDGKNLFCPDCAKKMMAEDLEEVTDQKVLAVMWRGLDSQLPRRGKM